MNSFFSNNKKIFSASAPGRLDVMGGIADYSGSLLLQMPIAERTTVAMQQRDDGVWNIVSKDLNGDEQFFSFDFSAHKNISYTELNKLLQQQHNGHWALYVIGCFYVLQKEKQIPLTGTNIYITSQIPVGKGVSSSAAVEVATICAYLQMLNTNLDEMQIPLLAQMAENFVVGAACGLMDQLSVYYGETNKLLPLICQPHTVMPAVEIPAGIGFCGIDSGIRHAVSGASYNDVRTAAFMGYSIIAQHCGASADELIKAKENYDFSSLPFHGFLANLSADEFTSEFSSLLPAEISGKEFLQQYKISTDRVTQIQPEKIYAVKFCAAHPVFENHRIKKFLQHLQHYSSAANKQQTLIEMGSLMFESHESYSAVGLGNFYTNELVSMVKHYGADKNLYGARISGGGSGGTVAVLYEGVNGLTAAKEIVEQYMLQYKEQVYFFEGSSEGAKWNHP